MPSIDRAAVTDAGARARKAGVPCVLCVDDTADIRALVSTILTRDGFQVLSASNGAEALEMMLREQPDAVLLDIKMPIIDGLEVLRRMSEEPLLAGIPVMMLTSNSQAENVHDALAHGARDFVVKPFEPAALRQRVRRLIAAQPASGSPAKTESRSGHATTPELRVSTRVLVVDDQPAILEIAREILRDRFDVDTARSGAGALALADRARPDVVLMDIFMPVMDGVEALRRLRRIPEMEHTTVLAMSLGTPEEQPFLAEFDGIVRKPLERSQLLRTVSQATGMSGLFSFVESGELTTLRFHENRLWDKNDTDERSRTGAADGKGQRFWDQSDIEALQQHAERAFARMLESGYSLFLIDLEQLENLPEHQVGAVISAVRSVSARALTCRFECCIVVPYRLQRTFHVVQDDLGVEIFWRMNEALRHIRRQIERRAAQSPPGR